MKSFVVVFTFFMLFRPLLPIVEYVVNYDYIIKELCVDKDKIENTCKGKCHLSKKMGEASEQHDPSNKPGFSYSEINSVYFLHLQPIFNFKTFYTLKTSAQDTYNCTYSFTELFSIFHPPIYL